MLSLTSFSCCPASRPRSVMVMDRLRGVPLTDLDAVRSITRGASACRRCRCAHCCPPCMLCRRWSSGSGVGVREAGRAGGRASRQAGEQGGADICTQASTGGSRHLDLW